MRPHQVHHPRAHQSLQKSLPAHLQTNLQPAVTTKKVLKNHRLRLARVTMRKVLRPAKVRRAAVAAEVARVQNRGKQDIFVKDCNTDVRLRRLESLK